MDDGSQTGGAQAGVGAELPEGWGERQERTISWIDPTPTTKAGLAMSGLEYLQAIVDGRMPPPPIGSLFDMRPVGVREGEATFSCVPHPSAFNPIGLIHGGLACTLLDSVAGCAVHTTLPAGVGYTSVEIKVSYLRPVRLGVELLARGWVTKPGSRIAFAEADIRDPDGKVVATASSTCAVLGPAR